MGAFKYREPGTPPQICWFNWSEVGPGLSEKLPKNFLYEIRVESHWLKGAPEVFQLYSPLYIIKSPSLTVLLDCGVGTRWWVAHSCDTHTCMHARMHSSIFEVVSVARSCSLSYLLICALVWQNRMKLIASTHGIHMSTSVMCVMTVLSCQVFVQPLIAWKLLVGGVSQGSPLYSITFRKLFLVELKYAVQWAWAV